MDGLRKNNQQQIANIADASYRVDRGNNGAYALGKQTGDEVSNKVQQYAYDANGNLLCTNTSSPSGAGGSNRKMLWDEENRLLSVADNGFVSNYWYDAAGERTVKESYDNEGVNINGAVSGARTGTSKFTAYISPYLVVNNGGYYSKHIYMGSQRIMSKLSSSDIFTTSPVNTTDLKVKYALQTASIKARFDSLGVAYNGTEQTGGLITSDAGKISTAQKYYYHSDHLGSASLITDGTGALVQYLAYTPSGEVFVDQRATSWSTRYKFNAKEQDEETGMYYFGARYYMPRENVWTTADPLAEKYSGISSYVYCFNNPVKYIDPDGRDAKVTIKGNKAIVSANG